MNYEIVILKDSDLVDAAIDVLHHTFVKEEKICNCVNILTDSPVIENSKHVITMGTKNLEDLARYVIKDGISLAAVNPIDMKVLGFAINKLEGATDIGFFENFPISTGRKDECFQAAIDAVAKVDTKINLFEYYNATCGIELFMLCVNSEFKGHGIGRRLVEATIDLAKKHEQASFVFSFFSSTFSQKAGIRAGMDPVLKIPYEEFDYKGRLFSEVAGRDHPIALLAGIKVK